MRIATPAELSPVPEAEAPRDCPLCPRLVAFRQECRIEFPTWWTAPGPAFGDRDAWMAIVGLAPGKHGANRTGRPFTGDYAGILLYQTLHRYGFASRPVAESRSDGLRLKDCRITNAVKCLPPGNRTLPSEEANCRPFLEAAIDALPALTTFVALGKVAHDSLCRIYGLPPSRTKFAHDAERSLPDGRRLIDSYHCSRYNQNIGRLDRKMFEAVFERALQLA